MSTMPTCPPGAPRLPRRGVPNRLRRWKSQMGDDMEQDMFGAMSTRHPTGNPVGLPRHKREPMARLLRSTQYEHQIRELKWYSPVTTTVSSSDSDTSQPPPFLDQFFSQTLVFMQASHPLPEPSSIQQSAPPPRAQAAPVYDMMQSGLHREAQAFVLSPHASTVCEDTPPLARRLDDANEVTVLEGTPEMPVRKRSDVAAFDSDDDVPMRDPSSTPASPFLSRPAAFRTGGSAAPTSGSSSLAGEAYRGSGGTAHSQNHNPNHGNKPPRRRSDDGGRMGRGSEEFHRKSGQFDKMLEDDQWTNPTVAAAAASARALSTKTSSTRQQQL